LITMSHMPSCSSSPNKSNPETEDEFDRYAEYDELHYQRDLFRLKRTLGEIQTEMRRDPALRILVTEGWAAYERFTAQHFKKR
jgi:hypothetical protein